jgi:aryl-alcohol dehydrogenase-like predicted oxidoreductase
MERTLMITRRSALQLSMGAAVALMCDRLVADTKTKLITRRIPSSGEELPIIGIGTSRRFDVSTAEEREPLREVLRELPKLGGKLVDTAPSYGAAETVVGDLVAEIGNRKQLFIATKVGAGRDGAEAGLAEMNDNQYEALEAIMKREPLDFVQIDYALDNRGAGDRILPLAKDRGIAVLINLPFGRGRVLKPFGEKPVPEWAKEMGIETWAQFALKYVVSHPAVTSAIPGTAKLTYLRDNLGAARGPLPDEATRAKMVALLES